MMHIRNLHALHLWINPECRQKVIVITCVCVSVCVFHESNTWYCCFVDNNGFEMLQVDNSAFNKKEFVLC